MALTLGFGKKRSSSSFTEEREGIATESARGTQEQRTDGQTTTAGRTSQQQTSSQTGRTSGTGASSLQSEQLTELFGADVLAQLEAQFATGGGDVSAIQSFLTDRALNADSDLAGIVDPIVANARRQGERKVGQSKQALARGAGSSLNSLVTQLGLEGEAELEAQLASLSATLGLQVRQQATDELQGAAGLASGTNLQVAELLKGATTRTTGTQEQQTQSQEDQLTEALSSILGTTDTEELQKLVQAITSTNESTRTIQETASGTGRSRSTSIGFSG